MYEKAARTGNLLYRATTLGGTALTLILFLWKGPMGTFRLVLFLAWLVACTACVATLNLLDRAANAEKAAAKTVWRWIGVSCLTI